MTWYLKDKREGKLKSEKLIQVILQTMKVNGT